MISGYLDNRIAGAQALQSELAGQDLAYYDAPVSGHGRRQSRHGGGDVRRAGRGLRRIGTAV